jgi:hypothetical protein
VTGRIAPRIDEADLLAGGIEEDQGTRLEPDTATPTRRPSISSQMIVTLKLLTVAGVVLMALWYLDQMLAG